MKKIFIFGASGDTGRYFIEYLCNMGMDQTFQIIAIGRRLKPEFIPSAVTYYSFDIQEKLNFSALPREDIYAVVDLAGLMPARMEGYSPYPYININILGTLNILEFCKEARCDRILFAQSFGDIKDQAENNLVLYPDTPQKFSYTSDHTVYVISKNTAVQLIEHYHQQYGLKSFIFRLPTIYLYSPIDYYYVDGVKRKIAYRAIIDNAIEGKTLEIWGDPSREKDMVYIKDFCQMLYLALLVDKTHGYYNVGTGVGTSLVEQIKGIAKIFNPRNRNSEIIYRPDKPNAPKYVMDITDAVNDLGYSPKYPYEVWLADFKDEMERQ